MKKETEVSQTLKVFLWTPFNLQVIDLKGNFVVILPTVRESINIGDTMSVCVLHKGVYKEVAKAKILRRRQVCLGGVMPAEWVAHIGPREKETFIEQVKKLYGRDVDDYNFVSVITLKPERIYDEILLPLKQGR